jgi:cytochrome P450
MCKTLLQVVERRWSGQEKHDDFIQHIVDCEALQNEAEKQSDLQLLDNLVLMMFAGHETSSITIMWLLKYLEDNPLVQETLRVSFDLMVSTPFSRQLWLKDFFFFFVVLFCFGVYV